jgi:ribonuclease P protein component
MISRQHRFHSFSSVRRVYQRGNRVRGQLLSLQYMTSERQKSYRAAVVVSRKVDKSAVRRNRIRRRLYEVLRSYETQIVRPYDLVFTVYGKEINDLPPIELNKLVHDQLQYAHILENPAPTSQHAIVKGKDS